MKISRNALCPCESGLKYKKCCLNASEILLPYETNSKLHNRLKERIDNKFIISDNINKEVKMSGVLLEFAHEILEKANTKSQRESAISIACIAWNMAILGSNESDKEDIFKKITNSDQEREDLEDILSYLIRRKLNKYSHINRLVVEYQYIERMGDMRLEVASTIYSELSPDPMLA